MGMIYRPMVKGKTAPLTDGGAKARCPDAKHGRADECPTCHARFGRVWWIKFYQNGRPIRESAETEKETEARRRLKAKEGRVATGQPLLPRVERITYDELARDLVQYYKTTGRRRLSEVEDRLAHLTRFFQGRRAVSIGPALVTEYVAKRQGETTRGGPTSNRTVNIELGLLKRMFRLAYENNKVFRVPPIKSLKEAPPRQGFFETDQYRAVKRHLPPDLQAALAVAHTFGWRTRSEVLTLELRQVDLVAGTIRLDPGQTKNQDGRVVYLTPELIGLLRAQVDRVKQLMRERSAVIPYLFPHLSPGRHQGQRRKDFRKAWETACRKAGCPGMLKHDLRRTAVRNMVNLGVPERVAMTVTGHKTRAVFDRYHIVSPADLQEATRKLAGTGTGTTGQIGLDAIAASARQSGPSGE